MLYIFMFHENISVGLRVIKQMRFPISKYSKGQNSIKKVDGIMVLVLCTSSDHALYLFSFMKISQRVSQILSRHNFQYSNFQTTDQ